MAQQQTINPQLISSYKYPESTYVYTERDVALYALGVGACGRDALDDTELKYVYHEDGQQSIQVLPTFASLLSLGSITTSLPTFEFDPRLLLHGQQYIEIYKPLPSSGCLQNKASVSGFHDKVKAAVMEVETTSHDKETGELLCSNRVTTFLRGAGGFSDPSNPYSYSKYPVETFKVPNGLPSVVYKDCTQPSQALLYRLSGDYNPLHSDPMFAKVAGFSRPILHGLCTLGFAVRAIIKCICKGDPTLIRSILGRFLLHVYPGETLVTEMWLEGSSVIYQTKVQERNKTVLSGFVNLTRAFSSL